MQVSKIEELTMNEVEQVNGGFLVNIGMGIGGSAAGMGAYSVSGAISGNGLTGCGFVDGFTNNAYFGGASATAAYNACLFLRK